MSTHTLGQRATLPGAPPWLVAAARRGAAVVAVLVAVELVFHPPTSTVVDGMGSGSMYGLLAVGILLIYRTNRIINVAAAGIGAVPGVLAVELSLRYGVPYLVSLGACLIGGFAFGALMDALIIRWFRSAPRLIVTVATIGLVQLLAFLSLIEQSVFATNQSGIGVLLLSPFRRFTITNSQDQPVVRGEILFTLAVAAAGCCALVAFLRRTRTGVAMRAAAENSDRALLMGIPVGRLELIAWGIAGAIGAGVIFLRSSLIGLPADATLGYAVLLYALTAAVVARLESIWVALVAGLLIGVVEASASVATGAGSLTSAVMLGVILVALLFQRTGLSRAADLAASTWRTVAEARPVPAALRRLPEVVIVRCLLLGAAAAFAMAAPNLVTAGQISKLTLIPITAIVAVSLVVLTGWAGQVSLGQYAIVGVAAVVTGRLVSTFNLDFFLAVPAGIAAGTLAGVAVAVPALRVQGLLLAVSTLGLAEAMQDYLLSPQYPVGAFMLPGANPGVRRPLLLERFDLTDNLTFYHLTLLGLALALAVAWSFRRHRSGRLLIAARDNPRAASAYAVNVVRARIAAFAVSGAIASLGGVLLAYQQRAIDAPTYGVAPSILVFIAVVLGGTGSLSGAVMGAVLVSGVSNFVDPHWAYASLFVTGPGVIITLLFIPGGIGQLLARSRDAMLRGVARRRGIHVPSLEGNEARA